jgi:hypothetical protein
VGSWRWEGLKEGIPLLRHGRGNPDTELSGEPKRRTGKPCGEAEGDCERESPPAVQGESYQAEY